MAKSVQLSNGKKWRTQKEALSHFKKMLARYSNGDTIDSIDDHDDLLALVERYDQLELGGPSKVGPGIDYFERRLNRGEGYSSPGFWAIRVDGTETDFSYPRAVKGVPATILEQYYAACRAAVGADLAAAKQRQFDHFADLDGKIICDVSGIPVAFLQAQLRHAPPYFGKIVEGFRETKGWSKDDLATRLTASADAQTSTTFLQKEDAEAFRAFHHAQAVLHIVSNSPEHGCFRAKDHAVKRPIRLA